MDIIIVVICLGLAVRYLWRHFTAAVHHNTPCSGCRGCGIASQKMAGTCRDKRHCLPKTPSPSMGEGWDGG